jgi:hypothetical protein
MARGWGRNEEDLQADREQAREPRTGGSRFSTSEEARRDAERRAIDLSLARIEQELAKGPPENRRKSLEAARLELRKRREAVPPS